VIVRRLRVARGTGGAGLHRGGDGLEKEIEFTAPCVVSLLTERRRRAPYGLAGGAPGACGANELRRAGAPGFEALPARATFDAEAGDRLRIRTPGGGGHGAAS
jgi:N-methylhydantoinase B